MAHIMERIVRGREVDKLGKRVREPPVNHPSNVRGRSMPEHRKVHQRLRDTCQNMT